jgi:hypothetical protein
MRMRDKPWSFTHTRTRRPHTITELHRKSEYVILLLATVNIRDCCASLDCEKEL